MLLIKIKRAGGAFFNCLNNTLFGFDKYDPFFFLFSLKVDRNNYKHNCLYLALQAGGLSDIKLQQFIDGQNYPKRYLPEPLESY